LEAAGKDWDVSGSWTISCPHFEKEYRVEDLTMDVFSEQTRKGSQLFAKFDFGMNSGIMRFETLELDEATRKTNAMNKAKTKTKTRETGFKGARWGPAKQGYFLNSGDPLDEDEDDRERSPTPDAFYLKSSVTKPSASHPTWSYRWGGSERGAYVDPAADERAYEITFEEPQGTKLTGKSGSAFTDEPIEFTGVKIGLGGRSSFEISDEWHENSENYRGW